MAALCKIADYCEYGTVVDDVWRDHLVCTISHKGVQRCLLQDPTLTFGEALKFAVSADAWDKDTQHLTSGGTAADKDQQTVHPTTQVPPVHE